MTKYLNIQFEKGVRLLAQKMPVADESSRKPVLFHDIRVGVYLYNHGYPEDVVLAGLLHDALEFSEISEQEIKDEFGENVLKLVKACSKNKTITDSDERINELIKRCTNNGEEALIVKTADILDSFQWYARQNNKDELGYCMKNANAIFQYKPENCQDKIFAELKKWQEKSSNLNI